MELSKKFLALWKSLLLLKTTSCLITIILDLYTSKVKLLAYLTLNQNTEERHGLICILTRTLMETLTPPSSPSKLLNYVKNSKIRVSTRDSGKKLPFRLLTLKEHNLNLFFNKLETAAKRRTLTTRSAPVLS